MKLIKKIIFWKLSLWFLIITFLRNKFYDFGFLKSYSFSTPIVSIGNLSAGGTGKTPMVEFLIDKLEDKYKIGVLSRGYKRKSSGFILASAVDDAKSIVSRCHAWLVPILRDRNIPFMREVNACVSFPDSLDESCNLVER